MERVFKDGIGAGGRSTLSYWLPDGVFHWLEGFAGLHAEFGRGGVLEFRVLAGERVLWERVVHGGGSAAGFRIPVEGVTRLQLVVNGKGGEPKEQYGIWGGVRLVK